MHSREARTVCTGRPTVPGAETVPETRQPRLYDPAASSS